MKICLSRLPHFKLKFVLYLLSELPSNIQFLVFTLLKGRKMSTFSFPTEELRIILFWKGSIAMVYYERLKSLNIKKIYWMIFATFCSDMIQISTLQNTKCLFIRIAARREREGERKKACLSICNTYTTCKQRCILT